MEISERIRYVDQLRAVSILFLIAINVAMVFKYKSVGNLQEYVVLQLLDSVFRYSLCF